MQLLEAEGVAVSVAARVAAGELVAHTASLAVVQATRTPQTQLLHGAHVGLPTPEKVPEAHAVHEAANDAPARGL